MNFSQKYNWLFEVLFRSQGGLTYAEISELWSKSPFSDGNPLPKRTFRDWIDHVENEFDVNIYCDRNRGNRYHIDKSTLNKEYVNFKLWVFNSVTQANLFTSCVQIKDRILFEEEYTDGNLLVQITNAMKMGRTLMMTYNGYQKDKRYMKEVQPHALKKFKQRWYMIVVTMPEGNHRSYALDRISQLEMTDHEYTFDEDFDVKGAFANSYGIYSSEGEEPTTIKLKINSNGRNYLRSLPLHWSQKEVETEEDYSIFELTLCPSFDFKQSLLDFEEQLEVLEPKWFRDEMKEIINKMYNIYQTEP